MATPKQILLGTLEDLGEDDFKKFKWLLQQEGVLEGFPAIRKSRLEKANRMETVDQMMQTYHINMIKVTRIVLKKIDRNDLLEKLSNTSEPTDRSLNKGESIYSLLYSFINQSTQMSNKLSAKNYLNL